MEAALASPTYRSLEQSQANIGYQADVDGLRAVAVLAVVLFHVPLGSWSIPGGYTGVDVFFVISGYLITGILLRQIDKPSVLREFYLRRARRILPAFLVVLAVSIVAGYFLLFAGDLADLGASTTAALLAVSNLHFYWNTDYFDQASELMPLLHTWSLAVEEQFYLVWPALLLVFNRLGGLALLRTGCIAIVVFSFIYSVYLSGIDSKAAFYSPLSRAWELGLGALVALMPLRKVGNTLALSVEVLAVCLIAYSFFGLTEANQFPGFNALYACLGTALLLAVRAERSPFRLFLKSRPMSSIGLISYSLYLWHWPVLVFFLHYSSNQELEISESLVIVAVSFLLAYLSWRWVEQPFRQPAKRPGVRKLIALYTVLAIGAAAAYVSASDGLLARYADGVKPYLSLSEMWKWSEERESVIDGLPNSTVVIGADWATAEHRMVLWGDSHAEHMAPLLDQAIRDSAAKPSTSILLYRACPAIVDGDQTRRIDKDLTYNEGCRAQRGRIIDFLAEHAASIDAVLLASAWNMAVPHLAGANSETDFADVLASTTRLITRYGIPVVLIGQIPQFRADPIPCLLAERSSLPRTQCDAALLTISSRERHPGGAFVERVFAALADEDERVAFYSPSQQLCDEQLCTVELNGAFLYRDSNHLRRNMTVVNRRKLMEHMQFELLLQAASHSPADASSL